MERGESETEDDITPSSENMTPSSARERERNRRGMQSLPEAVGSPGFAPTMLRGQFGIEPYSAKCDGATPQLFPIIRYYHKIYYTIIYITQTTVLSLLTGIPLLCF